jgi:hypothetical protein
VTWVRIDDRYATHQKMLRAGGIAIAVDVAGMCYCAGHGTDGFIPTEALAAAAPFLNKRQAMAAAGRLVEVGRWVPIDGGWRIHDYLTYNPSAAEAAKERWRRAENTRKWRERRSGDRSPHDDRDDAVTPARPPVTEREPEGELSLIDPSRDPSPDPDPAAASPAGSSQAAADLAAEPQNNGQPPTKAQRAALRAALAPQPKELTAEEGRQLFDQRARQFFGISGEEFVRCYHAGELDPDTDDNVGRLAMLLPFWHDERRRQDADAEEVNEP